MVHLDQVGLVGLAAQVVRMVPVVRVGLEDLVDQEDL